MILYFKKELDNNPEFMLWKNKYSSEKIEAVEDTPVIDYDKSILIAASSQAVAYARNHNMAVLGFQAPEVAMSDFLQVSYVILGFEEIDMEFVDRVYRRHHNLPWTILETQRCVVRELTMEDMDALFNLYSQPGVTDYIEPLYEYEKECEYERAYIKNMYGYFGYGMWLVFHRETGELIGRAGLEHRDYSPEELSELELGYLIDPRFQGQGYATEICQAIIRHAREELDFSRINCLIDQANTPSIKLARRLGFEPAQGNPQRYILDLDAPPSL